MCPLVNFVQAKSSGMFLHASFTLSPNFHSGRAVDMRWGAFIMIGSYSQLVGIVTERVDFDNEEVR